MNCKGNENNYFVQNIPLDEVRLRRTFHGIVLTPSGAHPRCACMVFLIEIGSSTRLPSSRPSQQLRLKKSCTKMKNFLEKTANFVAINQNSCNNF